MKAIVVVDLQNDFCPGGALSVWGGNQIIPLVNSLLPKFEVRVATQDWHPPDHKSFAVNHGKKPGDVVELNGIEQALWPVHCVQGTKGAAFAPEFQVNLVEKVFQKGTNKEVDSYSGFFDNDRHSATGLGDYLKQKGVIDVYVVGLGRDYCVKHTALDAQRLGYRTHVIVDACRGVDLKWGDSDKALANMRKFGIKTLKSTEM